MTFNLSHRAGKSREQLIIAAAGLATCGDCESYDSDEANGF